MSKINESDYLHLVRRAYTERYASKDWTKEWRENQKITEKYFQLSDSEILEGEPKSLRRQRFEQLINAGGNSWSAIFTQLFFAYLGGLVQARKQFIPGFLFFRNRYYNWLGGFKYIAGGYLIGFILSTFAFGHPFLLEDYIRSKFRGLTVQQAIERPYPYHFRTTKNVIPPRDPFIQHDY